MVRSLLLMLSSIFMASTISLLDCSTVLAQPAGYKGVIAKKKAEVIFQANPAIVYSPKLPRQCKAIQLDDFSLTGPKPSHPFVLGHFTSNGNWGLINAGIERIDGEDAALQLAWAKDFLLEGIIEQQGYGGWFFLVGWDEGRGFAIHNHTMKESGSPWFISEFRGGVALDDRTTEFGKLEWKGEQPFTLKVEDEQMSLKVGRFQIFADQPLENYTAGNIILGVYDTRYGPRPIHIKSLRIKSLDDDAK